MKKRSLISLVAVGLACNMLFSSCIGSFGLFNKLLDWNRSLDSKLVNELVFVAFCIVPVYGIAYAADILVLNSIEFWSGTNPVADVGSVKTIETDKGLYAVETKENGYQIQKEGEEAIDLVYNQDNRTWSVEANGESTDLLRFESDDEVVMFLPDGTEMPVELNQAGVLAFKQAVEQSTYYAAR
ncbi:hypothetical protein M2137_000823 [Parabacteroides sp. PFB2-10]|uniref:DUF3332 domain-containing protein n=1 Tax=Parabacteroides sp. PFB2-10 TaxID=1742405 RepID=UPI0024732E61|nr:DUF3332 domain-containing protein [Parabacteroides sp. PFB2-10]MDH6312060.1 hypothetical protein [Parabacteroides sp. PFB2-10]MDL2244071.1 DUF3332 domain-containing protein [Parabacteroides sp. OttesenSCG-928-J18]